MSSSKKQTTINIRVDEKMKSDFNNAAKRQRQTPAAIMRGLITAYIELDTKMAGRQFNFGLIGHDLTDVQGASNKDVKRAFKKVAKSFIKSQK